MLARGRHRVRQFFGALRPHVHDADRREAYPWLNEAQQLVFESMMLRDQQHGIEVFRRVSLSSPRDAPLIVAALLHDCGKGQVRLWQRVAHVLMPSGVRRTLASETGASWRRAFWRLTHHPELGAVTVAATGADPDAVRMIREQEAPARDRRLALLQAADDA